MNSNVLSQLFSQHLDPDRVMTHGSAIFELDRWNSFHRYRQTADYLESHFRKFGADRVERIAIPCDGKYRFGDWVMPLAWDAEAGTLELIGHGDRAARLLADYRAVPNNLIRWSRGTRPGGEILKLAYLPDATTARAWSEAGVKGKLVFTHSGPDHEIYGLAVKHGAAGIVTDFSTAPSEYRHQVNWWNTWGTHELWGVTREDQPLLGFSLSPAKGQQLRALVRRSRVPVRVRANVRARLYEGTTDIVSALIRGHANPNQEVVFYAHVYECQIDDNAVSAGVLLEMVRLIQEMVRKGSLPVPRRSIRVVLGWEWVGSEWYALECKKQREWLASLCLDGIATRQALTREPLCLHLSPGFSASFADGLFVDLWKRHAAPNLPTVAWKTAPWHGGTDTNWIDPLAGNVSNIFPYQTVGPTWHKSHSSPAMIDLRVLRQTALTALLWAWRIADASVEDAQQFAAQSAVRMEDEIRRRCLAFDFARQGVADARRQFAFEIDLLHQKGDRVINTTPLAPANRDLARTIARLRQRIGRVIAEECRLAHDRFGATARALPRWEAERPLDYSQDTLERVADNLVPHRLIRGGIWSQNRMTWEQRCAFKNSRSDFDPCFFFLCDGQRTVADITRELYLEFGRHLNLRDLLRSMKLLQETGYLRLEPRRVFSRQNLVTGLHRLGVRKGNVVLAHTSLFSFGPVDGGAKTVIAALEEAIGPGGTLALTAFAYNTVKDYPDTPYDARTTPTRTGQLPALFIQRPGVMRSQHPSHSLAATGRHAAYLLEGNRDYSPYDIRGAFGKLYQLDAKILMLGCGLAPNSTLHAIEDWLGLPSMRPDTYHYLNNGRRHVIRYQKEPFYHRDFYTPELSHYERLFRHQGLLREGMVGLARSFLMKTREVVDCGIEQARCGCFEFLYCDNPKCAACVRMKKEVRKNWRFPRGLPPTMRRLAVNRQRT